MEHYHRAVLLSVSLGKFEKLGGKSQSVVDMASNMPDGAAAISHFLHYRLNSYLITVEHESFKAVAGGVQPPIFSAEFEENNAPTVNAAQLSYDLLGRMVCKNRRMAVVMITCEQIKEHLHLICRSPILSGNRQTFIDKVTNIPSGSVALTRKHEPTMGFWLIGIEHESLPIIKGVDDIAIINAEFKSSKSIPVITKGCLPKEIDNFAYHSEKFRSPDYLRDPDKWYLDAPEEGIEKSLVTTQSHDPDSKTIADAIKHDGISHTGQVGLIDR